MHIAMIGQKGPLTRKDAGGIERHVDELSRRLVARGHRVTVFARTRYGASAERSGEPRIVTAASIPTKALDAITHAWTATCKALASDADVIHYHGVGPATVAWLPRVVKPRVRVIVTFHSIDRLHGKWGPFARAYLAYAEWAAVRFPHRTIAVSRTIQRYCRDRFRAEVDYVPNGAEPIDDVGDASLAQWGLARDGYLLTVARLVPQKGIHHLLRAYATLETDKPLVVAGDAPANDRYARELREMSEGNGMVRFVGFQQGAALRQLFGNAYLYVHPSEAEGLSISILEAMSAGRCVLVSDIPENVESIDHNGLTFVNADVDDLRERIGELLRHPEIVRERGEKARRWVRAEYDWEAITERTVGVYRG